VVQVAPGLLQAGQAVVAHPVLAPDQVVQVTADQDLQQNGKGAITISLNFITFFINHGILGISGNPFFIMTIRCIFVFF
jgi:hypothetical protein